MAETGKKPTKSGIHKAGTTLEVFDFEEKTFGYPPFRDELRAVLPIREGLEGIEIYKVSFLLPLEFLR